MEKSDHIAAQTDLAKPTDQVAVPAGEAPLTKESDGDVITRLAALGNIEYDRARRDAATAMGIQVKTLDDLVKAARTEVTGVARLPFEDVEPHPDPVNPATVLDEVVTVLQRYIVMSPEQADAVALWIMLTWLIKDVEVAPILIINAPEKACGKSQLLTIVGYFVARPLSAANSTASFLFRAITSWNPTMLVDEADTFIRENDELKGLVNAGHTRANAFVGRTVSVGDGHEPVLFDVWGAKAFAGISLEHHFPDATLSRGIVINLRRKQAHEKVERLRYAPKDMFKAIAAKLARFAEDYAQQVRGARMALPDELSDRAQDNWEPLLAIASCAGPAWVSRATDAALKLSCDSISAPSTSNELLADIQQVFEYKQVHKISTIDLIAALLKDDEKSWSTYNRGKPLSPRQLAQKLAVYGIKSKTVRHGNATPKGYELEQFQDAFARYLASPGKLKQQQNAETPPESTAQVDATTPRVADTAQQEPPWFDPVTMEESFGVADTSGTEDDPDMY